MRVRIDEDEDISAGNLCAGVTNSRDLTVVNFDNRRPGIPGDLPRSISRCVISDDYFEWLAGLLGGRAQYAQRLAEQRLFVVCGYDERNQRSVCQ